jgi:hypothetical protein
MERVNLPNFYIPRRQPRWNLPERCTMMRWHLEGCPALKLFTGVDGGFYENGKRSVLFKLVLRVLISP